MEKAVDFCFRKGKAVGETKPTERGDRTFEVGFLKEGEAPVEGEQQAPEGTADFNKEAAENL